MPNDIDFKLKSRYAHGRWRGGRVAEGARLESVYTAMYRGFESLSLRHPTRLGSFHEISFLMKIRSLSFRYFGMIPMQ